MEDFLDLESRLLDIQLQYLYRCTVDRVVDGDTIDVTIDLGFKIYSKQRIRLGGIDAPEPRGDSRTEGKAATAYLETLLEGVDHLYVFTGKKTGSFNRYLGGFYFTIEDFLQGFQKSLNAQMVEDGHAVYKEYR